MQSKTTPDERFLIRLYELAGEEVSIRYKKVAKAMGIKDSALKNMIKLLAQANFIQKMDEETLLVTKRGARFVQDHKPVV